MTDPATRLVAGLLIATVAMLLTHPLAVAATLALALAYAHRERVQASTPWVHRSALGIGLAVLAFNALFSWNGATALWEAPVTIALLGRPRLTLEALSFGATAGAQLAATVLALGTATLKTPPETLHRALTRTGLPAWFATAAGLALRLVPDTARDAHAMDRALQARGVPTRGLRGKSHVLVPLTARSLDRAMVAEEALLTRGYDPDNDTPTRLPPVAWLGILGTLIALLVAWAGPGRPSFYPTLEPATTPLPLGLILLALALPMLLTWRTEPCSDTTT